MVKRKKHAVRAKRRKPHDGVSNVGRAVLLRNSAENQQHHHVEAQLATLAQAVQSTGELISITDLEDRFTFVNRAFQNTYGYAESEILGQTPDLIFSPKNPPQLMAEILEQTRAGGWRGEVWDRRKDGTDFPIFLSTSEIKDSTGRVIGLMGVARDISEEKRLERQRGALSQLGYRLSAAGTPEQAAAIIMDLASELFGWDAGYFHLYSEVTDEIFRVMTVDTLAGKRMPVPPPTSSLQPSPLMRRVMDTGAQLIIREEKVTIPHYVMPFGDLKHRSASLMFVPIRSGGAVVGILSIQSYTPRAYSMDDLILLQTLADYSGNALQRIKVSDALREAEAKYRSIFENATEGIFQTTPDGRYLSANPALARMFGYASGAEMISMVKDIERETYASPEKRNELKRLLETEPIVRGFEAERCRKDGSTFWISINGHVVRDPSGAVLYYEGTNQDITEIVRAREALLRNRQELERLVSERTAELEKVNQNLRAEMEDRHRLEQQVLQSIEREQQRIGQDLHDGLCQLLTGIKFKTSSLEAELGKRGMSEAREAKAIEDLVNQAIRQSYGLARGLNPVKLPVHGLHSALAELAQGFEAAFNLRCVCELSGAPSFEDQTVANHLYRIAQEAIHNAVKHGRAKEIIVSLRKQDKHVALTVSDNGVGFSAEAEARNGMGLPNMLARARMIGASLEIHPGGKGGTVVLCLLPAPPPAKPG